jgi:hypothetical protein
MVNVIWSEGWNGQFWRDRICTYWRTTPHFPTSAIKRANKLTGRNYNEMKNCLFYLGTRCIIDLQLILVICGSWTLIGMTNVCIQGIWLEWKVLRDSIVQLIFLNLHFMMNPIKKIVMRKGSCSKTLPHHTHSDFDKVWGRKAVKKCTKIQPQPQRTKGK